MHRKMYLHEWIQSFGGFVRWCNVMSPKVIKHGLCVCEREKERKTESDAG